MKYESIGTLIVHMTILEKEKKKQKKYLHLL